MSQFSRFIREFKIPKKGDMEVAIQSFSKKEWSIFVGLIIVTMVSAVIILQKINLHFMVEIPAYGGTLSEGIIGTPRFINPILAISDADKDLSALVYSGLMKRTADGTLIHDLAESHTISDDELTYTFKLKQGLVFHDGTPITADDVIYTINQAKDPLIKSPRKINWEGVTVLKVDQMTVSFVLKQPYASFIDNATLGILPSTIWKDITPEEFSFSDLNTDGVGSGPYMIDKIKKKSSGIASYYRLSAFTKYSLGKPYIKDLEVYFYANEKDLLSGLSRGEVDQINEISPEEALFLKQQGYKVETSVLPRVFGIFFNQNEQPIFTDKSVILAINTALNKEDITDKVLFGYGVAINSPLPPQNTNIKNESTGLTGNIEEAKKILEKGGWVMGTDGVLEKGDKKGKTRLAFSLSTSNSPELTQAVKYIIEELAPLGIKVEPKTFETGALNQNIIRPRKYDALFFGEIVAKPTDLYSFWHSSQRNDPGLNVALYANTKVDKILEKMLTTLDPEERKALRTDFENEITKDYPAIFIYSPEFIYVSNDKLKSYSIGNIASPSERFATLPSWYIETDKVWKIFSHS